MARASLLFLELRLKPLSRLKPHYYLICWGSSHFHGSSLIIIQWVRLERLTWLDPHNTNTKIPEGYAKSDVRHVQSWPDTSLCAFMQCINVYKQKYRPGRGQVDIFYVNKKCKQLYVNIKNYWPGHDAYVRFMFSHKHVYYMYTRLCAFRQALIFYEFIWGCLTIFEA